MSDFKEDIIEETPEVKADDSFSETPKMEKKKEKKPAKDATADFIARKLKVINNQASAARAKAQAERVLANKRKAVK